MSDRQRLAYAFFTMVDCGECGLPFDEARIRFESVSEESDHDLESEYECGECGVSYELEVTENRMDMYGHWKRTDTGDSDSHHTMKHALYREAHPNRDLVDGLEALDTLTRMLYVSKQRLKEHTDMRESGFGTFPKLTLIDADVHNYLATSYSLKEGIDAVSDVVPTDAAKAQQERYEECNRVIIGLRIYIQHHRHFNIELKYDNPPQATLSVDLEGVKQMGKQDYKRGFDYHYGGVEGYSINLSRCIEEHFEATAAYIDALHQFCEQEYADELDDYRRKTNPFTLVIEEQQTSSS